MTWWSHVLRSQILVATNLQCSGSSCLQAWLRMKPTNDISPRNCASVALSACWLDQVLPPPSCSLARARLCPTFSIVDFPSTWSQQLFMPSQTWPKDNCCLWHSSEKWEMHHVMTANVHSDSFIPCMLKMDNVVVKARILSWCKKESYTIDHVLCWLMDLCSVVGTFTIGDTFWKQACVAFQQACVAFQRCFSNDDKSWQLWQQWGHFFRMFL